MGPAPAGYPTAMTRRWPAIVVLTAVATATPLLLTSCNDDKDPTAPTMTLKQETINPNVSVGSAAPAND
jgi:hypothetical protein